MDFLGSGIPAQTTDEILADFIRYAHIFSENVFSENGYVGAQFVSSNYTIGAEDFVQIGLELIGLTGFKSNGIGLVAEYETLDNKRNPTTGN